MFLYRPHFLPTSIVLIGAGGTGSRLLPPMAQLVKTCLRRFSPMALLEKCDIYVVDGDIVEEKNLSRQNFIAPDVGRNKALVVAERYSRAFGINVIPCTEFLTPKTKDKFEGPAGDIAFSTIFENAVVIFAVDSAKARKEILGFMNRFCTPNLFVIDAGNEDDFGQIKTFTGHSLLNSNGDIGRTLEGLPEVIPCTIETDFIPMDFAYYRNLGESAVERSCADLPQTLAINTMMSTLILCTLQNFLQLRGMNYDGQSFSLTGGSSTTWNTAKSWAKRVIDWDRRTADEENFLRGAGRRNAGIAMRKAVSGEEHNVFWRLRNECVKSYDQAGMILGADGKLTAKNPPPAPKLKAKPVEQPKEVDELKGLPPAPPLRVLTVPEIPAEAVAVPSAMPEAPTVRRVRRNGQTGPEAAEISAF